MSSVTSGAPRVVTIAGIELTLVRKRVKNINLRVKPTGEVYVSAPPSVSLAELERIVGARRAWIARARDRVLRRNGDGLALCDGDVLPLWGNPITIHHVVHPVTSGILRHQCHVDTDAPNVLVMDLDERTCGMDEDAVEARRRLVDTLYKSQMVLAAPEALIEAEGITRKKASRLRYRKMRTRWGSCNVQTASVTLNTGLAAYPPECLRYVLVHELCHLHEPSHNARFHELMDGFCPDWRTWRNRLKEGPLVV